MCWLVVVMVMAVAHARIFLLLVVWQKHTKYTLANLGGASGHAIKEPPPNDRLQCLGIPGDKLPGSTVIFSL